MTLLHSELAAIDALIADAEAELARYKHRLAQEGGPAPDPADPFDPASCFELWLKALRRYRAQLLLGTRPELMPSRPAWLN